MAQVVFDSWLEAYEYQVNSRNDDNDPLFLWDYHVDSGIFAIDTLIGTTGNDIVWLVVVEHGIEKYKQYGVGLNQKWYSIEFDGYDHPLSQVEGSLKEYSALPYLVNDDDDATVVYEFIEEIFDVFKFLTTGKILPTDLESEVYKQNSEFMIRYVKEQLSSFSQESEDDFEEEEWEEEEWEEDFEEDEDWGCAFEEQEEDFFEEEDFEEIDDDFGYWNESDENQLTIESVEQQETPIELPEFPEEEKHTYKFSYGNDGEKIKTLYETVTCEVANEIFAKLVDEGHQIVELAKVMRIHRFY